MSEKILYNLTVIIIILYKPDFFYETSDIMSEDNENQISWTFIIFNWPKTYASWIRIEFILECHGLEKLGFDNSNSMLYFDKLKYKTCVYSVIIIKQIQYICPISNIENKIDHMKEDEAGQIYFSSVRQVT